MKTIDEIIDSFGERRTCRQLVPLKPGERAPFDALEIYGQVLPDGFRLETDDELRARIDPPREA